MGVAYLIIHFIGAILPFLAFVTIVLVLVIVVAPDVSRLLSPEEWQVLATFFGPVVAVGLGAYLALWQVLRAQEARDVRERDLTNGISRFKRNIGELTSVSLRNYLVVLELWRTLRDFPKGFPLAPEPDDLPPLHPIDASLLSFDAVAITQEILGTEEIAKWSAHVFSDTTLAYREYEAQVRQPLRRYYDPNISEDKFGGDREAVLKDVRSLIDRLNKKATRHLRLFDILQGVEASVLSSGLARYGDVAKLRRDPDIVKLADVMAQDYLRIEEQDNREVADRAANSPTAE